MNDSLKKACELSADRKADAIPDSLSGPEFSKDHENAIRQIEDSLKPKKRHPVLKVMIAAAVIITLSISVLAVTDTGRYIFRKVSGHTEFSVEEPYQGDLHEGITVGTVPAGYELEYSILTEKYSYNSYLSMDSEGYPNGCFGIAKLTSDMVYCYDDDLFGKREIVNYEGKTYVVLSTDNGSASSDYRLLWSEGDSIYVITFSEARTFSFGFTVDEMLVIADSVR